MMGISNGQLVKFMIGIYSSVPFAIINKRTFNRVRTKSHAYSHNSHKVTHVDETQEDKPASTGITDIDQL